MSEEDSKSISISYADFLEEKILSKKIDTITNVQKLKLINAFSTFPIGRSITLKMDEIVNFTPKPNQSNNEYVHHFLTKFNIERDWYSENYILLVNDLVTNLSNYDERILEVRENEGRVCFVKHIPARRKKPYHIIACKILDDNQITVWTHFDAKESYVKSIRNQEETVIQIKGLRTIENEKVSSNFEEYQDLKRKTPLYLGSGVLSELRKS